MKTKFEVDFKKHSDPELGELVKVLGSCLTYGLSSFWSPGTTWCLSTTARSSSYSKPPQIEPRVAPEYLLLYHENTQNKMKWSWKYAYFDVNIQYKHAIRNKNKWIFSMFFSFLRVWFSFNRTKSQPVFSKIKIYE